MAIQVIGCTLAALLAVMFSALSAQVAFAESAPVGTTFVVDDITYAVTDEGEVSLGSGKVGEQAISREWSGALIIPETVEHRSETYRVTSVAPYACTGCTHLTEVSIPASVAKLGFNAFGYCGTMDDSGDKPSFEGLTKVEIAPDSQLYFIGENAFIKDYALHAFTIPASVENISMRAFQDCYSFEYFRCEEGSQLKGIAKRAFAASQPAMDPDTISSHAAGPDAWPTTQSVQEDADEKRYAHLKSVHLPASLTSLGDGAFENQRALEELEWADGCEMDIIGEYSFQYCSSLQEASVPAVLHAPEGLGPYSFQYCVNLRTFTYKGFIRAPYSGYSERGLFRGDTNLATVIYLTDKYHLPHGTSTTIDTARNTFTDCDPNVYYRVTFYASQKDAEAGTNPMGSAIIRENTPLSSITSAISASDEAGAVLYSGEVPDLAEGYGWTTPLGGGATPLSNATYAYPVRGDDLTGAGIVLSETNFTYSGQACTPEVEVRNTSGTVIDSGEYTLIWERKASDETWVETSDLTSPGNLRVRAQARTASVFTGTTQPASFSISLLESEDEFTVDGVLYTVITDALHGTPTAMIGDGYGRDRAIDAATQGIVTVPETVYPNGSALGYTVTQIAPNAFGAPDAANACGNISEIVLPESIQVIGGGAFRNMGALESITLPSSLAEIKANAFANDTNLSSVQFAGDAIATIGVRAFANCDSLTSIALPAITNSLGANAFANCPNLEEVTFTGDVAATATNQFSGSDFVTRMLFCGNNPEFDLGDFVTCYARVTFQSDEGTPLGTADILVGTELARIDADLPAERILAGAIPIRPDGSSDWQFGCEEDRLIGATTATVTLPKQPPADKPNEQPDADSADESSAQGQTVTSIEDGKTYTAGSKKSKAVYQVLSSADLTVAYKTCKSTSKKAATVPATVTIENQTFDVVKVAAKAFKSKKKVKTVTVKSRKISSFSKAFAKSKVAKVKVPASKKKAYKKLLKKKLCGRTVKVV